MTAASIRSVASFFVSRVDVEIDKRLDGLGTDEAKELKGKAGLANARLAYQVFQEAFSSERWKLLAEAGFADGFSMELSVPNDRYLNGTVVAQALVFPLFGFHAAPAQHLAIGAIFTGVSLIRSFALRRLFEAIRQQAVR